MENFFIDMHCHPSMKPYGHSFGIRPGYHDANPHKKNCIWYYDPPNLLERGLQLLTGISKFTQADCSTLIYGRTQLVCASLYPVERGFFRNKLGTGIVSDLAGSFVTGVSKPRVDAIQNMTDYFEDLEREQQFYIDLNDKVIKNSTGSYKYHLVKDNFDLIKTVQEEADQKTVLFLFTIEGLHVLNNNIDAPPDEQSFLNNVQKIKDWKYPPFFVTFAHHFYNHLCGHARSLFDLVGKETYQEDGLDTGFTNLGYKVVNALLSKANGKRILIDIKHMSAKARQEYFQYLDDHYKEERIPIIVSHGAANGLRSMNEPVVDGKDTAPKLLDKDINFYDDEIIRVARSKGIFALQLDERRIASPAALHNIKHSLFMNKIRHYRSELVWNQIQHIVELLDRNGIFAWDCISIGSDFEGIINPVNGFLTEETMPDLLNYLERHVYNYMQGKGKQLQAYNQLEAAEIVNRTFHSNAFQFIQQWL